TAQSLLLPPFFFTDPAPTQFYTLSLHDALPIFDPPCESVTVTWIAPVRSSEYVWLAENVVSPGPRLSVVSGEPSPQRMTAVCASVGLPLANPPWSVSESPSSSDGALVVMVRSCGPRLSTATEASACTPLAESLTCSVR